MSGVILPILALLGIITMSTALHELGHYFVARKLGWEFQGVVVRWYGVGVEMETKANPDALWLSALGGLGMTAVLTLVCFLLSPLSIWLWCAFVLNAALLISNLIPVPILDGGHVFAHFRKATGERGRIQKMARSQAQDLTVTIADDGKIRVSIDPATNTSTAQPFGVTRVGDTQTIEITPAE